MPTQSIIRACQLKFAALTAGNFPGGVRPELYFHEAPQTTGAGAQVQASSQGYVVLRDKGQDVVIQSFRLETREVATFDFEVYYPALADVDAAVLAIKRNGGTTADRLGFDFGSLSDLASPRGTFVIRRTREQREQAGLGKDGKPVHLCRVSYRVEILEDA